jgi:hypothetical protein
VPGSSSLKRWEAKSAESGRSSREAVEGCAQQCVWVESLQIVSPDGANQTSPAVCASLPRCAVFWNVARVPLGRAPSWLATADGIQPAHLPLDSRRYEGSQHRAQAGAQVTLPQKPLDSVDTDGGRVEGDEDGAATSVAGPAGRACACCRRRWCRSG